jgi:6-pyruvoyltetrahydropterin/6-carboxytetrahydropterin synthase
MSKTTQRSVYLICKSFFNAAHRLHNPHLSPQENKAIYGPCNNENGHGHNYILEVHIKGETNPLTGFLMDLAVLKAVVDREIIQFCDHKHLNYDVPWLEGIIPTSENLAFAFWDRLVDKIPTGKLCTIRLYETEKNIVEYKGE